MHGRRVVHGGRMQNYHVTPVRYTLAAGSGDTERHGARLAGFLYVVVGVLLVSPVLMPVLGSFGRMVMTMFAPFWGVIGLVTISPWGTGPWALLTVGSTLVVVGIGILRDWPIFYATGMGLAVVLFMPVFPAGTLVGVVLAIAVWRGFKRLGWPELDEAALDDAEMTGPGNARR